MDWIEQLFGFSPDGGDGTAEALIVLACCSVLGAVIFWRFPGLRNGARRLLQRRSIGS